MKIAFLCLLLMTLASCAQRVLVKDCQKLSGSELENCELVKKL